MSGVRRVKVTVGELPNVIISALSQSRNCAPDRPASQPLQTKGNIEEMENINPFVYNVSPSRVIFGPGSVNQLAPELKRQNLERPLLLSTPQQVDQISALSDQLDGNVAGIFSEAKMHTPSDITDKALVYVNNVKADCVISLGGGSTIGLGKAISIRTGLPHICIPTTYAGSEMTPILGETRDGVKKTISDPKILPGVVIYDVDLTMTLPVNMSATSGVNAIAHSVEAMYSPNGNPIINLLALESIKCLAASLPELVSDPSNVVTRTHVQYGAWLAGLCLGSVGMGLHHKLCHTLGGSFNMPHAETHTIVLAHALAYNSPRIPGVMKQLAEVLPGSNGDAVAGLNVLLEKLKVERKLEAFGFREGDIDKAAELACANEYPNPRPVEKAPIRELIKRVWAGEPARANL
ncbi:maleylacetate reductase [Aureobasidium pullulans]|uniref:Maleylacetate reductase n=1 Tax=Aureobasidium pullulans TaxID=5580 RepID=A0A4S8X6X3_AURPU|nr:maleylacetate reductase [Aureobasidium pullulans]